MFSFATDADSNRTVALNLKQTILLLITKSVAVKSVSMVISQQLRI